jgi:hypothetical protein
MKVGRNHGRCLGVVVVLAMAPALAQAYIDPGNGAYMVQALFTVIAAGIFYLKHPVRTLKSVGAWLSSLGRKSQPEVSLSAEPDHATIGRNVSAAAPSDEI